MRAFIFIIVPFIACASAPPATTSPLAPTTASPSAPSSSVCSRDADCAAEQVCGYAVKDQCRAAGACVRRGPKCNRVSPGCACSGQTINIGCDGYPSGYVAQPLAYEGPCAAGASAPPQGSLQGPAIGPSTCANGGAPCGDTCCGRGEKCCPGGMANSHYCRANDGTECPARQ